MRITFRKGPHYDGMMRLPASYTASCSGKKIATIQQHGGLWFWYGDGQNTSHRPVTLDEAKAEIVAHFSKEKT